MDIPREDLDPVVDLVFALWDGYATEQVSLDEYESAEEAFLAFVGKYGLEDRMKMEGLGWMLPTA